MLHEICKSLHFSSGNKLPLYFHGVQAKVLVLPDISRALWQVLGCFFEKNRSFSPVQEPVHLGMEPGRDLCLGLFQGKPNRLAHVHFDLA